ncbi:hypothetical protein [Pelagibacterium lentulum]|uniref:Uncharacterized protein n=1 Tax=Pelagibacterium lentulum TaxID=2029865 RepID=A0A916RDA0_9HYPH|nr:hypothetical protein [Pelagibacterium lentulum]GGA53056.1 hypothetical protein GCM10011499_23980 [Pelagibacterium lentulum]
MLRHSAALGIASLLALSGTSPSLAQNVHTSRLYEQVLENVEIALPGHVLDSFGIVRLDKNQSSRITMDVPGGISVQIMGDCDKDCVDLDLMVYGAEGKLLGEDRLEDFYPIVNFQSGQGGRIELVLDLVDCAATYCYAAYTVFLEEQ